MTNTTVREMTEEDIAELLATAKEAGQMINYDTIPPMIMEGLKNYVERGIPTGGFLEAVLANDLMAAVGGADPNSMMALPSIVSYVYMELPSTCHGSYKVYRAWLALCYASERGIEGDELQELADKVTEAKREANEWRR